MTIYGALNGNASGSYELMSYATPVLTTANNYTLKATGVGNHLRRAILVAPPTGGGIDHPIGSRFLFLNHQGTAPSSGSKGSLLSNGPGIGIYVLPLAVLALSSGTLYFKFPMFNIFGGGLQDLSSATAYTYKPGGIVAAVNPAGVGPQIFQVN